MLETLDWGKVTTDGVEVWDTTPVFSSAHVSTRDRLKLLFYPKKFLLYRWIRKYLSTRAREYVSTEPFRILDVGCGTGATLIDLKRWFGSAIDVVGIDVVRLQVELGQRKLKEAGVVAEVQWYDGVRIPFPDQSFDAIYTSDVLGHVQAVDPWLRELNRVLEPGGVLAMFTESALGRHAWIRSYLFRRGLNVDPHAPFHISLFSKNELQKKIETSGFTINQMYSVFWPAFFLHPEEFFEPLQSQKRFPVLRMVNRFLTFLKKKTYPFSTAVVELYGLVEMVTIGRWVESQGYIVLAYKVESARRVSSSVSHDS